MSVKSTDSEQHKADGTVGGSATTAVSRIGVLTDVLCAVDGTHSAYDAVRQAAALAGQDGRLTLLAASASGGSGRYHGARLAPERAQTVLEEAQRIVGELGVSCETEVETTGQVEQVVIERASGHGVLALGAPSMSRLAHLLVGGLATTAAHTLPCALLVARRPPSDGRFDERIMVASDALDHSDELVDFAIELARSRGASLMLLHAPGSESAFHPTRLEAQSERVREGLGERASICVEPGHARQTIVQTAAAEGTSLIVLAGARASGLHALGSVSERVVHDAPCSVLVLRPEDLADDAQRR